MAARKGRPPGLSRADTELFRRAMKGVKPHHDRDVNVPQEEWSRPPPEPMPEPMPGSVPAKPRTGKAAPGKLPELRPGVMAGVDRRTAERLRRGRLSVEATLDLHRHTQDEAHRALMGFITDAAAEGRRCVLVITGKGALSEGGGVLRRQVPHWLNQPPCRECVLAIAEARPEHGGAGALYVLLRRRR